MWLSKSITVYFTVALAAAIGMTACTPTEDKDRPEYTVQAYYRAVFDGNLDKAYSLVALKERSYKSLEEFRNWLIRRGMWDQTVKLLEDQLEVKLLGAEYDQEQAKVTVQLTRPNLTLFYAETFPEYAEEIYQGDLDSIDLDKRVKAVKQAVKNSSPPLVTRTTNLHLVRTADGWGMTFNWKTEAYYHNLYLEAIVMEKTSRREEALKRYEEVAKFDPYFEDVQERVSRLRQWKTNRDEMLRYASENMSVGDVQIFQGALGDWVVMGRLHNNGKRTLEEVGLTIRYLDKRGKKVDEQMRLPIMKDALSEDRRGPLKPGGSVRFNFPVGKVDENWSRKVKIDITYVSFQ